MRFWWCALAHAPSAGRIYDNNVHLYKGFIYLLRMHVNSFFRDLLCLSICLRKLKISFIPTKHVVSKKGDTMDAGFGLFDEDLRRVSVYVSAAVVT